MFIDNSDFFNHAQCYVHEKYFAQTLKETSCWQLAQENEDFRFDYYVCQECIVYLYAKTTDEFIKQQIEKILYERKILNNDLPTC